jgi:hypothetical protein
MPVVRRVQADTRVSAGSSRWFVLGFDYDDIVGAWQDWRLARQCVAALRAAHRPPTAGILESAGEGKHLTFWYVSDEIADALDRGGVPWRRYVIDEVDAPPAVATRPLKPE